MSNQTDRQLTGRKVIVTQFGGPDVLESMPTIIGSAPPGHVRLRVLAIGVGSTDLIARAGDYILERRARFTPGYELIAEVVDTGTTEHERLAPGTLVAVVLPKMGAYADYVIVPSWLPVPLPDGLDPVVAATLPLDYLTASSILETHARVARGDTVLIQAAGGGVGQALSQLGQHKGLTMYGTASAPGSAEKLARNGVQFIDYRSDDFETVIRSREPNGIQAVFDGIGGTNIGKNYRLLARGGVLVSYAFVGRPGHIVRDSIRGSIAVKLRGLQPGRRTALCMTPREAKSDHDWYRRSLRRVLDMAHTGELQPPTAATFPLEKAADAHRALENREINAKVVLTTESA